jgi:hypothetical protein
MAMFKLPLSGDVVQSINPFSSWFSPSGGQFGLVNINLGQSSAPTVEQEALEEVGSYGKQLGKIGDALVVLLKHLPKAGLTDDDKKAVGELEDMLGKIADIKQRHNRKGMRPVSRTSGKSRGIP